MNVPHKHVEIIKAWAEGYQIEAYNPERDSWISVAEPGWFADIEYRVKPGVIERTRVINEEYVVRIDQNPFDEDSLDLTNECQKYQHYNLKLLFKNGDLVDAEVIDHNDEEDLPW